MEVNICRICLLNDITKIDIFSRYKGEYRLADIIQELSAREDDYIVYDESLPRTICNECAEKLVDFHLFRSLLLESHQKLLAARLIEPIVKVEHDIAFVAIKSENEDEDTLDYSAADRRVHKTKNQKLNDENEQKNSLESSLKRSSGYVIKCSNKMRKDEKSTSSTTSSSTKESKKPQSPSTSEPTKTKAKLEVPKLEKSLPKQFICEKCEETFPDRWVFLRHFQNFHLHTAGSKFKCPLCPRLFTGPISKSNIHRHVKTVHRKKCRVNNGQLEIVTDNEESPPDLGLSIKCADCSESFPNAIDMYEHSKVHNPKCKETVDGYNLECDECQLMLPSVEEFGAHMRGIHNTLSEEPIRPIKCHLCGERFAREQGLYMHVRFARHFNEDPAAVRIRSTNAPKSTTPKVKAKSYLCTICGKLLGNYLSFQTHLRIHSNSKPFKCDVCSTSFRQYSSRAAHMAIHTNERKYKCTECGKCFKQNPHLKTHLKTHGIGIEKWHACSICDKQFNTKGNLTVHMWIHKPGHQFQCSECGKGFARKNKMEAHMKKEHTFH